MSRWLLLLSLVAVGSASHRNNMHCAKGLNTVNFGLRDAYCEQPVFVNFIQKTEENVLLDNICHTFFPLPDDPSTFQVYFSRVYCDGSNEIISFIATEVELGLSRFGSPYCTFSDTVFGYAGCDTYLVYRCFEYGDCGALDGILLFGLSKQCKPIGLSCLRKVEEIASDNGLPELDMFVLPMKLPNRCVTQQLCLQPPNPFYNTLSGYGGRALYY